MIIQENKELIITNIAGDTKLKTAGIADSSKGVIFEMVSKYFYSKPIPSIVRELTSNCFDSHKEAGVEDAVVIDQKEDDEGDYISFKDVGVGLSPERIDNIYMQYFSSTKRDDNTQIGGFGLGSKSPLAYTDYFYINTIFNGIKYQYNFSKGEEAPTLSLLHSEETTERNGTEIRIYFKEIKDIGKFQEALSTELCYFDNVYFLNWQIENDYRIYETDNFKYRNKDQYSDEMHIALGKVSYPINWDEISMQPVKIPIGVKFEIGELQVTPNRETIRYTSDEIKDLIKTRISNCLEELKTMYRDDTMVYEDWFEYLKNKDKRPYIVLNAEEIKLDKANEIPFVKEDKLYLTGLKEQKAVYKPFYDLGIETEYYDLPGIMSKMYTNAGNITSVEKLSSSYQGIFNRFQHLVRIVTSKDRNFTNIKNLRDLKSDVFIKQKLNRDFVKLMGGFIGKTSVVTGYNNRNINREHFNLGIAIKCYKLYKHVESLLNPLIVDYNRPLTEYDQEQYQEYRNDKNKINIERKALGKFPIFDISQDNYGYEEKYDIYIADINRFKGIIIYGFKEDEGKLKALHNHLHYFNDLQCMTKYYYKTHTSYSRRTVKQPNRDYDLEKYCLNPKAIKILRIGKYNEKHFKGKNMVHIDEFSSNNRIFRKLATIFKIEKVIRGLMEHQTSHDNKFLVKYFTKINKDLGENLAALFKYRDKYTFISPTRNASSSDYSGFKKEMLELAEKNNWFDSSIEQELKYVEGWFEGIEILKFTEFNEQSLPYILKYLYDNKKKLNLKYYMKHVCPVKYNIQIEMDFEPKEETETELFKIIKQVA